ncbi:ATP-binding protein [Shewanella zhangzhouensis]|uniref:ATP-binding protein n=1 Tax=Shewanella zhangzhouensis TaxID=2864213 RepID=UPI001C6602C5|nr:ATP-binding protein [Shewanella zhangzhouensis]QYK04935.1 GHKL domain-containing protein [Shewanella zhangzhouensis]
MSDPASTPKPSPEPKPAPEPLSQPRPASGVIDRLSLKTRLFVSAAILVALLLPALGIALFQAFERQALAGSRDELGALIYSVLAQTDVIDGQLEMPPFLNEPQFNVDGSGLYAEVRSGSGSGKGEVLWRSGSLIGHGAIDKLPSPAPGADAKVFGETTLNGEPLFVMSFTALYESKGVDVPLSIHILKSQQRYREALTEFESSLWRYLLLALALLAVVLGLWLRWTLKPLSRFEAELKAVEHGDKERIDSDYPAELGPLVHQLNSLLTTEQNQRKRYRNALSDLAHSLKTPLAVLQSHPGLDEAVMEQVDSISHSISHQLKRAQSAGAASWHQGVEILPQAERLSRTLSKIHGDKGIDFELKLTADLVFKGDKGDLTELLGNLLDNACKAARSRVCLTATKHDGRLRLIVEDDGPGVDDSMREKIFERGIRADTYDKGHGIGLAIVRDLTDAYQGKLRVERSDLLGGARFEVSFPQ